MTIPVFVPANTSFAFCSLSVPFLPPSFNCHADHLPIDDTSRNLVTIHERLLAYFRLPPPSWHPDPVWQLIFAIVGKKTNGRKPHAASMQLLRNFHTPHQIMSTPARDIRKAISTWFSRTRKPSRSRWRRSPSGRTGCRSTFWRIGRKRMWCEGKNTPMRKMPDRGCVQDSAIRQSQQFP